MFVPVRRGTNYRVLWDVGRCKELLRFESKKMVDFLVAECLSVNEAKRRGATSRKQIEVLLHCTGGPGFQTCVAEDFGVDRTTACKTDQNLLEAQEWTLGSTI